MVGTRVYIDDINEERLAWEALIQKSSSQFMIYRLTAITLLLNVVVLASVLTARTVANSILRVATNMAEDADQVTTAAGQVSSASQSLAKGPSEQAASLEESSASLEEMASMNKRNAENAQKANELAKDARSPADNGVGDMAAMSDAMQAIKVSFDDIAKIIKTIDEIAFQTDILELRAAVAAARAVEAGMGFAMVADEVRNLAQRGPKPPSKRQTKSRALSTRRARGWKSAIWYRCLPPCSISLTESRRRTSLQNQTKLSSYSLIILGNISTKRSSLSVGRSRMVRGANPTERLNVHVLQ
ncbi:MAG: methyl-accepting chemotaxis protein [Verrucomicrobiota bacterium]|jgi:hypothetical protein